MIPSLGGDAAYFARCRSARRRRRPRHRTTCAERPGSIGARPGDVLKITGGTVGVARAEASDESMWASIQIDGTARSNCGVGLQEQVTVAPVEHAQAVAVRFSPHVGRRRARNHRARKNA